MVGESDPDPEKEEEEVAERNDADARPGSHKLPLRREPSFSRWCGEDGIELASRSPEGSCDSSSSAAADESEDFELPLLHWDGPRSGPQVPEGQRSSYFRQRSMYSSAVGYDDGIASGRRYASFNIENGLHASNSTAKLESLEMSAHSSVSSVVVLKTLFYIVVWYTFSTCLTLYNKSLLGDKLGKFPAPLLMNTFHFTLQAVLSKAIMCFQSRGPDSSIQMTWRDYFIRVVPTALGTALDINLSNVSLVFISVTFATMCKSASPIFLLLFAFAFRLESPSIKLLGIILIISIGVLLTVAKETEFEFWGFAFVMLAAVMSGFRWSMTQILLQKEAYGLHNPITLMSYVSPVMAVGTAVLSLLLDPWHDFEATVYFDNTWHIIRSCLLMLIGGALAFFMVLTEYILVSATSAVTVTIAGVVKEAVTILVAVFYFHDPFTLLKGMGLLTIMVGVGLFNWYKYKKLRKGPPSESEEMTSSISNGEAKYVIFDELDFQDDNT